MNLKSKTDKREGISKVLVLGLSPLPFENEQKLNSLNFRTWHFTKPLLRDGHNVMLVCARIPSSYRGEESLASIIRSVDHNLIYYSVKKPLFDDISFLQTLHDKFNPDCIIGVNAYAAARAVEIQSSRPVWADLNGYFMGEAQTNAWVHNDDYYLVRHWEQERRVVEKADVFSAVSTPQKYALVGELGAVGRLSRLTLGYEFAYRVPNSIEDEEYEHRKTLLRGTLVGPDDFVVLWSGGYNTWTDVDTLFKGLTLAMKRNSRIKFVSTGGAISEYDEKTFFRFLDDVKASRFSKRYIFLGWVPSEDIPNYYFESDVGINVDKFCYETLVGARYRIVDMLKGGLPVLTTRGTEISEEVETHGLGKTFGIGQPSELADALLSLAHERDRLRELGRRAKEFCFKYYTCEKTTLPVRKWAREPWLAPDRDRRFHLLERSYSRSSKLRNYVHLVRKNGFTKTNLKVLEWIIPRVVRRRHRTQVDRNTQVGTSSLRCKEDE